MCYRRHSLVLTNSEDHTENTENNPEARPKYVFQNNRRSTDRYWSSLFVIIFIFWIASWHYLIVFHKKDYKVNLNLNDLPEVVHNATHYKVDYDNSTTTNTTLEFSLCYWIFDTITCNIRFLDAHYPKYGAILIGANVLFCVCLITNSLSSIHSDHIFYNQIVDFGKFFTLILLTYRVSMFSAVVLTFLKSYPIHYDIKIALWVIPEAIFILICATKKSPEGDYEETDDEDDAKISFHKFRTYVLHTALAVPFFLKILIFVTARNVHKLGFDNPVFYTITVGSCYIGLIFFYFGLMVISCATSIAIDSPADSRKTVLFLRASYIVGRYHFGTACYHATLILPRLHAALVMNEAEFRKKPNFSAAKRFYMTHWEVYNVSPIVTAVLGENHSGSMRELLRLSTSDSSTVKHFQGFSKICTSFTSLFIGANSLLLTLLWALGAIVDPRFPMGTWVMIVTVMFLIYLYMRVNDAVFDAIWFHVGDEDMVKF